MSAFRSSALVSVAVAIGFLVALPALAEEAADVLDIAGTITIVQEGSTFTSHSEFKTLTPGTDIVPAKVLGTGNGVIEGSKLTGTGDNQLQSSSVPGLDVDFGMIPHQKVSQSIRSKWTAEVSGDGTIKLVSDNTAAEGEPDYSPTQTTLEGRRVEGGPGS
jgi:hypothetical protein